MGSFFSRKKKSTLEQLEVLEKEIQKLEGTKASHLQRQRQVIGSLLLYSFLLYVLVALVFFFYYFPQKWTNRFIYSMPLLFFPIIIWLVKRFLHWYFVRRISRNESALERLQAEKSQLLDEVMETQTYKKARELLELFDPERLKLMQNPTSTTDQYPANGKKDLRRRTIGHIPVSSDALDVSMANQMTSPPRMPQPPGTPAQPQLPLTPPGPPMPREVLPRERSISDRLVDFIVADGPNNRYALICRQCHSHNGMALREEFEFLTFRCCYCFALNPARKQKPSAPRLETSLPSSALTSQTVSSGASALPYPEKDNMPQHLDVPRSPSSARSDSANSTDQAREVRVLSTRDRAETPGSTDGDSAKVKTN